tara:strand:- start:377 stop:1507 length:1131 start_codon:yes stop_codon:yes gene_type:complete
MKFSTMPQYELGERYSKDRTSSKYKRAARRLRKKGYGAEAGKMALQAEVERLNEPTIMRPEHRELEAREQERLLQMRRAASPSASPSAYDPSQSMADLRGNFFSDISAANLPASEQAMFSNRFETKLSDMSKQQKAYTDLQAAQRKNRDEQRVAQLTPLVTSRVREIMASSDSDSNKQKKLTSTMLSPNIAPTLSNTTISSIFTSAADQLKINKTDKQKLTDFVEKQSDKGDASFVDQASPEMQSNLKAVALRERSKETRDEELKELEDIEGILSSLRRGNSDDPAIQAMLQAQGLPASKDNKEILIEVLLLLKYPTRKNIPEGEKSRLADMDEKDLYIEAYQGLLTQKGALSMRAMQEVAAANPAAQAAVSSWGQ